MGLMKMVFCMGMSALLFGEAQIAATVDTGGGYQCKEGSPAEHQLDT